MEAAKMKVGELRDTRAIEALRKKEREKVMRRALALILGIMLTLGSVSAMCEGPVEIEFWHYFESSNDKVMVEQRVEEYNRIQSRVHINANYVSRQEMMRRYAIGAISGELPDIGMVDSPDMAAYISLGLFVDITDALKEWGELDHFYPGPLQSCMDSEGRLYGLPHNTSCLALAVNMDLLRAAGYDHPPVDLEEFRAIAAATTDAESGVYGFAMSCIGTEEGTFQLLPWLRSAPDGVGANVDDLTAQSAVDGLTVLSECIQNGWMNQECVGWNQADTWYSFCAGQAAMAECGTWHLSMTGDIGGAFEYDFCLLPTGNAGVSTSTIGGENIGLCAGCADEAGCLDFLEWLCSAENEAAWAVGAGKNPPRDDCAVEYPYEQRGFEVFAEEMRFAQARGPHPEWPAISAAICDACQSVFVDGVAPADALAEAKARIEPIVAEYPLP